MTRTGCVGEMIGFGAFDVLFVEMLIGLLIGLLIELLIGLLKRLRN